MRHTGEANWPSQLLLCPLSWPEHCLTVPCSAEQFLLTLSLSHLLFPKPQNAHSQLSIGNLAAYVTKKQKAVSGHVKYHFIIKFSPASFPRLGPPSSSSGGFFLLPFSSTSVLDHIPDLLQDCDPPASTTLSSIAQLAFLLILPLSRTQCCGFHF